jgi:ABC transporter substrate binding protein
MTRVWSMVTLIVTALAAPLAAQAQPAERVHRIGLLRVGAPPATFIEPFRQGLRERGYVEGHSFIIEYGLAGNVEQLPEIAAELLRRKVDVLVASGTPSVVPAKNATKTVPVVFVAAIDPVATGVVVSLARPGGNVTGVSAVFDPHRPRWLRCLGARPGAFRIRGGRADVVAGGPIGERSGASLAGVRHARFESCALSFHPWNLLIQCSSIPKLAPETRAR